MVRVSRRPQGRSLFLPIRRLFRNYAGLFSVLYIVSLCLVAQVAWSTRKTINAVTDAERTTIRLLHMSRAVQDNTVHVLEWWRRHPREPLGLSCDQGQPRSFEFPAEPIFEARTPAVSSERRLALVIPVLELRKVRAVMEHWKQVQPCKLPASESGTLVVVFAIMGSENDSVKTELIRYFDSLEASKACFGKNSPMLLTFVRNHAYDYMSDTDYLFYRLFEELERDFSAFFFAEPETLPIQSNWAPVLVVASRQIHCSDGLWQLGSSSLGLPHNGKTDTVENFYIHGNGLFVLGCRGFEEYKCRLQTFFRPQMDLSAERKRHSLQQIEMRRQYDHLLYEFRVLPENYRYARSVLHRFGYTPLIQYLGEDDINTQAVVQSSPDTYFVNSKSVYRNGPENTLRRLFLGLLNTNPDLHKEVSMKLYTGLRTGELNEDAATRFVCRYFRVNHPLCSTFFRLRDNWEDRFPGKAYIWSIDFHGGPIHCDIPVIVDAGGVVHAEIDYGNCVFYGLCKERLKVLTFDNWRGFDPSDSVRRRFYQAYKSDAEFRRVDAVVCSHPAANCELFVELDKPLIVHATTRLEFGRDDAGIDWRLPSYDAKKAKVKWTRWLTTLRVLSADTRNVIAANNKYDAAYIQYFTGIQPLYLPSWCGNCDGAYADVDLKSPRSGGSRIPPLYAPTRSEILIVPYRTNLDRTRWVTGLSEKDHPIYRDLLSSLSRLPSDSSLRIQLISDVYNSSDPTQLSRHPALVVLPYQVSTISLFEIYRMSIPMFVPSLSLLKKWCWEYDIMWEATYGWPERPDEFQDDVPNPNGPEPRHDGTRKEDYNTWETRFDHWMPLADFYQWDHILYFDSWDDLAQKLVDTDFYTVSQKMQQRNERERKALVSAWKKILLRVQTSSNVSAKNGLASYEQLRGN